MDFTHLKRGEFGRVAGSSLLLAAMPSLVLADPGDSFSEHDGKHGRHHHHTDGPRHHRAAPTKQFIQCNWKLDFRSDAIPEDQWSFNFPRHGQANLLIDYKGNWQYAGSFGKQTTHYPSKVTIGVALKTLHTVIAFTKTFLVTSDGGNFSKQGRDPIVGDLWKDVLKGWDFKWSAEEFADPPPDPQLTAAQYAAINAANQQTASSAVLAALSTVGTILAFF
jgi:hypothetical protein